MSKDNGGPAFPFGQTDDQSGQLVNGWGSEGMSLRDWFAAKANEGDIQEVIFKNSKANVNNKITRQQARYMHADAMLEARKVKP